MDPEYQASGTNWPEWCCPLHQTPLEDRGDALVCANGERFPRKSEIPRFAEASTYADSFGVQWNRYRVTQLDSYTGLPISEDRTRRCVGEELWEGLRDKQVLECGCGAGRFTEILLRRGAYVTSVDLSEAVVANQENCPQGDRHRIAQADIMRLPFRLQAFDIVFCLGVVQHTANPEQTIARLYSQVKPGGTLIFDHYKYDLSWYTKAAPLFGAFLKRVAADRGIEWTERLVKALLPLHKIARGWYPAQAVLSRLSPVSSYYHALPDLRDELQMEWALLDTHDALTAWYRHARTERQIRRTLEELGAQEIWINHGGNGLEVRARRPTCSSWWKG